MPSLPFKHIPYLLTSACFFLTRLHGTHTPAPATGFKEFPKGLAACGEGAELGTTHGILLNGCRINSEVARYGNKLRLIRDPLCMYIQPYVNQHVDIDWRSIGNCKKQTYPPHHYPNNWIMMVPRLLSFWNHKKLRRQAMYCLRFIFTMFIYCLYISVHMLQPPKQQPPTRFRPIFTMSN